MKNLYLRSQDDKDEEEEDELLLLDSSSQSHSHSRSNSDINNSSLNDLSLDSSSLPSIVQPRFQVFPIPPSGVKSLIGGFVSLDGESVELPPSPNVNDGNKDDRENNSLAQNSNHSNHSNHSNSNHSNSNSSKNRSICHGCYAQVKSQDGDEEQEIVFELESQATSVSETNSNKNNNNNNSNKNNKRIPPSIVDLSKGSSNNSSTLGLVSKYDSIMTFKILGTQQHDTEFRPTLPANGKTALTTRPVSILRNPLPPKKNTPDTESSSFHHAFWASPVREVIVKKQQKQHPRTKDAAARSTATANTESVDNTTLPSTVVDHLLTLCCCPFWIQRSPTWLKLCLTASLLFFVAATVLIAIAVTLVLADPNSSNGNNNNNNSNAADRNLPPPQIPPTTPAMPVATSIPPTQPEMTPEVTVTPPDSTTTFTNTTISSNSTVDNDPTANSTMASWPTTGNQTMTPSTAPVPDTFAPTQAWDRTVVSFVVTAGVWDDRVNAAEVLPRLPIRQRRSFVVHLGDWNAGAADTADTADTTDTANNNCNRQRYEAVAELWSQSVSPVYFVVGNAESNACENPSQALRTWRDTLVDYHEQFWQRPPWTFWDDGSAGYPDAWVFDTNRIAIAGLHLTAHAETDGGRRPASRAALDWIEINYDFYRRDYRLLILMANAAVDDQVHADFFNTLFELLRGDYEDMEFVWIQPGNSPGVQTNYQNIDNLDVITVQRDTWPPMRIEIDSNGIISTDQDEWFDELTGLNTVA